MTHELIERLLAQRKLLRDDAHMMAVAGLLAERVVRDDQKRRLRAKRGGGNRGGALTAEVIAEYGGADSGVHDDEAGRDAVREALARFCVEHPRAAEVASLRMMLGLTPGETAEAMSIPVVTVDRDWRFARAWLGDVLARKLKHDGYTRRQPKHRP